MTAQSIFAPALLAPEASCPPGLVSWNGSDPARRFGVYRNNVIVALVDALADTYPVVQSLVGEDFFRATAAEFVRQAPPRTPVLAWYGADFADFLAGFPPAAALPYLPDVARLEWLRVTAWHAADAPALPHENLADLLADAGRLPGTSFLLHPALRVFSSAHPVVSLWAAHQHDDAEAALAAIDLARGEAALLLRPQLEVDIIGIEPGAATFIHCLQAGDTFACAAGVGGEFDLAATLGLLIRHGAIVATTARRSS